MYTCVRRRSNNDRFSFSIIHVVLPSLGKVLDWQSCVDHYHHTCQFIHHLQLVKIQRFHNESLINYKLHWIKLNNCRGVLDWIPMVKDIYSFEIFKYTCIQRESNSNLKYVVSKFTGLNIKSSDQRLTINGYSVYI